MFVSVSLSLLSESALVSVEEDGNCGFPIKLKIGLKVDISALADDVVSCDNIHSHCDPYFDFF